MDTSRPLSSLALPPSILSSLIRLGYETIQDLKGVPAESLAKDLKIPLSDVEKLLQVPVISPTQPLEIPLTQSAASMANKIRQFSTKSPAVDNLLSGGLPTGHILEVSGPPGTPKDIVATNLVTSFIESEQEVIFIDLQNMTSPAMLYETLRTSPNLLPSYSRLVYHLNIRELPGFMIFIHHLPSLLDSHPKVGLLVINSISFPFQGGHSLSIRAKSALLDRIKQTLTKATVTRNLTVVTTSQLSTKILNADGSPGTFDTGAKGIMVPQLGQAYLPLGRTYRIIFAAEGPQSGHIKLLSSPKYQHGTGPLPSVPYEVVSSPGQASPDKCTEFRRQEMEKYNKSYRKLSCPRLVEPSSVRA